MRIGLVAKKIGMTRIFDQSGDHHPVTIVKCPEALIVKSAHNSDNNVQIASFDTRKKSLNKAQIKEFEKLKSTYKAVRKEFKTDKIDEFKAGSVVNINHFSEGQFIDVQGKTIGKGFAGGMKRHGFGGLEATHGVSISHRSHGSTGQCQDPGKVFKGKKMAGHLGHNTVTIQNLKILKIDQENELIFIKGSVPGKKGTLLTIRDAVKKSLPSTALFPASFKVAEDKKKVGNSDNSKADDNAAVNQQAEQKDS
jgi:large subunit ribosomal protein L3